MYMYFLDDYSVFLNK